jgi:hypothetical protein
LGKEPEIAKIFWNAVQKQMYAQADTPAQLLRAKNLLEAVLANYPHIQYDLFKEIDTFINPI